MASHEETNSLKPKKFNGQHFKRWQKQMRNWLTVLGLFSAIKEVNPNESSGVTSWYTPQQINFHCLNRILSALSDRFFYVHQNNTTDAKELWGILEAEYRIADASIAFRNRHVVRLTQ